MKAPNTPSMKALGLKGAVLRFSGLLLVAVLLTGCSFSKITKADKKFYLGHPQEAIALLSTEDEFAGRDKLLFYMEKGAILHYAGKYQASIDTLLKASKLMEEQDVILVGSQSASIVTSEWLTVYKGEHNERLWVHTYLMMDFLLIQDYESALVEAKQAMKVLDEHAEPLGGDHFTRAMIALCFENLGEMNDAYIEYKKLAKSLPSSTQMTAKLYQLALASGNYDDAKRYRKQLTVSPEKKEAAPAEAIIFVGLGRGPRKVPSNIVVPPSIRFSFPRYENYSDTAHSIRFFKGGKRLFKKSLEGFEIDTNMNTVAKAALKDRAAAIIAKETARAAAKETIARTVGKKSHAPALELLVRLILLLTEEPDIRCWQTLPARQELIRLPLKVGHQKIHAVVYDAEGQVLHNIDLPEFDIAKGQKRFFSLRFGETLSYLGTPSIN